MKNLFTIIALLICSASFAQNTTPSPYSQFGQMLNTSNTIPNATKDTATDATALYLYTAKYNSSGLPAVYPTYGYGTMCFIVKGLKITGTPAGSVTLEESFDGVTWARVRLNNDPTIVSTLTDTGNIKTTYTYATPDVFTITNVATAQTFAWGLPIKFAPYYRLVIAGSGTQTSSWQAWYFFSKNFTFSN